jgi:hypothetical protein
MSVSEIQLFSILRKKLGDSEAQELVEFVKHEVKQELELQSTKLLTEQRAKEFFLSKDDKVDLIKWMVGLWLSAVALIVGLVKFI